MVQIPLLARRGNNLFGAILFDGTTTVTRPCVNDIWEAGMPEDAYVKPHEEKIRRITKEMIDRFGKAALHEATQRRNGYVSCGLSSDASTGTPDRHSNS